MTTTTAAAQGIAPALLEVQKSAPALHKDASNPAFKGAKYVTLDAVLEAVRPILNEHGVIVSQLPSYDKESGAPVLQTRLIHAETGAEFGCDTLMFVQKQDPQGQGSAITYARRYALLSILGLTADEDDDGNAGSQPASAPEPKAIQKWQAQSLAAILSEKGNDAFGARLAKLFGEPEDPETSMAERVLALTDQQADQLIKEFTG